MDAQTDIRQTRAGIASKNPHVRFSTLVNSRTAFERLKLSVLSRDLSSDFSDLSAGRLSKQCRESNYTISAVKR